MYDKVLNTTNKKRVTYITFNYLRKTTVNKKSLVSPVKNILRQETGKIKM